MKTVKDVCLTVAVAGMVAGAGAAIGCAVAYADPGPGSASNTDSGGADGSAAGRARGGHHGTARPGIAAGAPQGSGSSDRIANRRGRDAAAGAQASRPGASLDIPVPATPLLPVSPLPFPTPVTPVAPASATTVTASNYSRSRNAGLNASQIGDPPTHVLLIGTDGTNLSKILADPANVGFFDLMDQSITGSASLVGHTTISGPSWTTILTGVWDTKSGVINNIFSPRPYNSWPTVFNLLEYNEPSITTAVVADWIYINDMAEAGGYPVDESFYFTQVEGDKNWSQTDALVVQKTIDLIANSPADASSFIFSYQVQVDEVGHLYGGGSPEFAQAVTNVSDNIAAIMAAVNEWEDATGEDWTVIVTTDHGHQMSKGFGHGFQSPNETTSFVIFDLAGDDANDGNQNLAYSTVNITPTIVSLFNVPLRSDFDGVPMQTDQRILNSIVTPTNLTQALADAVAMYGYPNIGIDIALGIRTVVGSIPYFLDGFVTAVTGLLQGVVDQDIFLISALAGVLETVVEFTGGALVAATDAVAHVVGRLTGAGVIPPSDDPLPPPPAQSLTGVSALPAAVRA